MMDIVIQSLLTVLLTWVFKSAKNSSAVNSWWYTPVNVFRVITTDSTIVWIYYFLFPCDVYTFPIYHFTAWNAYFKWSVDNNVSLMEIYKNPSLSLGCPNWAVRQQFEKWMDFMDILRYLLPFLKVCLKIASTKDILHQYLVQHLSHSGTLYWSQFGNLMTPGTDSKINFSFTF